MKTTMTISKEDFMQKFVNKMTEEMFSRMPEDLKDRCTVSVQVRAKTNKPIDFRAIEITIDIPNE